MEQQTHGNLLQVSLTKAVNKAALLLFVLGTLSFTWGILPVSFLSQERQTSNLFFPFCARNLFKSTSEEYVLSIVSRILHLNDFYRSGPAILLGL